MPSYTAGPLLVNATCAPEGVMPFGFALPCGGMVTNAGPHTLQVDASVEAAAVATMPPTIPSPVSQRLAPKASVTLPQPGAGAQWVVIFATRRTLEEIGIGVLGGALVVSGLAGYGLVDLARHIAKRRTRRRR